ncbi:MAG: hypothetical protein HN704_16230 [Bacteroidetes bacterium]|jgi:hypothetical protein|nr:hypothetical protein [Bacteroidota bacterium]MBT6687811.1 hypothetical protein [Bacteroidota bacterium]MBT7143480.1 hypothetical protein [Bacteroidota bacterium]MBT7493146.1 hypothetical protein [Bacteroidota bacterium]
MNDNLPAGTRIDHSTYGEGIISRVNITSYEIFFERRGKVEISRTSDDIDILEISENENKESGIDLREIEELMSYVLDKYNSLNEIVPLGEKWKDGTMILQPADTNLKPKEIPVEVFFHKIVMLRDRLRVLEQNINSNKSLSDEEKVNIQQYISRAYGSLTTFNILFSDKEYYFKGAGKS